MEIWSHRGNPGPENSLAAFEAAYNQGIRNFETDIQVTRDGIIVLSHDSHTGRVSDRRLEIGTVSFAELNESPIGSQEPWGTLDELVSSFPQVNISIDLKSDSAVPAVLAWLKGRNYDKLTFGSFKGSRIAALRKHYPWLQTALTPGEITSVMLGRSLKVKEYWGIRQAMVPESFRGIRIIREKFVEDCHKENIEVHVWVVNSLADATRLRSIGVDGIVTDNYMLFVNQ